MVDLDFSEEPIVEKSNSFVNYPKNTGKTKVIKGFAQVSFELVVPVNVFLNERDIEVKFKAGWAKLFTEDKVTKKAPKVQQFKIGEAEYMD